MKPKLTILLIVFLSILLIAVEPAFCWSNGGYSANPSQPDYGTHDWIAQHALDYLPTQEKQYITDNLATYLLGTELPDNSDKAIGGIDDTTKHHVYYSATGTVTDDASAQRAATEYNMALNYLKNQDYTNAAKTAGTMTHYIADVAVFGHVMGSSTPWGAEDSNKHSNYENYVTDKTQAYTSTFDSYLHIDENLATISASDATKELAYNTTFGDSGSLTCTWMNSNYDWSNPTFKNRCGEELNLAVNAVADVLHTLYQEANPTATATPTSTPTPTPTATPSSTLNPPVNPTNIAQPTTNTLPTPTQQTQQPSTTPTTPEFPALLTLAAALLTILAFAVVYKKAQQKTANP